MKVLGAVICIFCFIGMCSEVVAGKMRPSLFIGALCFMALILFFPSLWWLMWIYPIVMAIGIVYLFFALLFEAIFK